MMKYLKTNDVDFYNLTVSYFNANNIKERFAMYSKMVSRVFYGNYSFWSTDKILPMILNVSDTETKNKAIKFWKELIS